MSTRFRLAEDHRLNFQGELRGLANVNCLFVFDSVASNLNCCRVPYDEGRLGVKHAAAEKPTELSALQIPAIWLAACKQARG